MKVTLVLFDQESVRSGAALATRIREYIDDNYVADAAVDEYGFTEEDARELSAIRRRRERVYRRQHAEAAVDEAEMTFAEKVFALTDQKGVKDSSLYGGKHELFFSKQVLSNMRKDRDYHPAKYVCITICLVLELNLAETLDLLERAGYALSRARKADVVVRGCIENGVHDYFKVNGELADNGCCEIRQIK